MKDVQKVSYTIILRGGARATLDFDETNEEIFDDLQNAVSAGGLWHAGNWMDAELTYAGEQLDFLNTQNVIGLR